MLLVIKQDPPPYTRECSLYHKGEKNTNQKSTKNSCNSV